MEEKVTCVRVPFLVYIRLLLRLCNINNVNWLQARADRARYVVPITKRKASAYFFFILREILVTFLGAQKKSVKKKKKALVSRSDDR